jgi:uncharacterized membrane protein
MLNGSGKINKFAITSVVLSAFGLFLFGGIFAGLGAVGCGLYAKNQIEKGNGSGKKLAVTGIWGGSAVIVLILFTILVEPEPLRPAPAQVTTWPGLIQHALDNVMGW